MIQVHELGDDGFPSPRLSVAKVETTIVLSFLLSVHEVALNARDKEAKVLKWRTSCDHS